jgi:NAD(P)-dependent dehydrogenase (short-subunit alcohol dehydrogenase family)
MAGLSDVSKEIILVTGAIMLRASNASRYMTGSVATVDGGFLLT